MSTQEWGHSRLPEVWLTATSGGTDVASGFVGGVPTIPVTTGEMQGRMLGAAVDVWDSKGTSIRDAVGELVITRPMPSMPLYLWNDSDGARYHEAYYSSYPGVWRHGDWATITSSGGVVVHGRSDATLNRFGVRIGTAEIYDAVEQLPEVADCLVVGIELADGGYWMPLFIQTRADQPMTPDLEAKIRQVIRTSASPRHVPDEIIEVPALPHTLTGKRPEIPLKRILQGVAPEIAGNPNSVDDPDALRWFAALAQTRAGR